MMERQDRERQEGRLGADETLFPEGAPQRHINWQDEGYELFRWDTDPGRARSEWGSYRRTP